MLERHPYSVHSRMYSLYLIKASATYCREGTGFNLEVECHRQSYLGFKKLVGGGKRLLCFGFIFEIYQYLWDLVPSYCTLYHHQISIK